ncbi:MAG: hypothetical protein OEY01_14675 [Desulfobulbaceae bacterium]|nr:hypothetical protein [Desulfobulbaceae bacterium]
MKTMKVTAKSGTRCPKEGKPREYIEGNGKFVEVPDTPYYRRLVKDGSLDTAETIKARKEAEAQAKASTKSGGSK